MHRSVAVLALSLALPARCEGLLGKAGARAQGGTAEVPASPSPTAPPVWAPAFEGVAAEAALPGAAGAVATVSAAPEVRPPSPELKKAIVAFEKGDHKKVRALLEKRVRSGKGTSDEARIVASSCAALGDKACADALRLFVQRE
jgi:hypothetical protein